MDAVELQFIDQPWRTVTFCVIAFVAAWAVSRLSKRLAEWMVGRYEAKHFDPATASTDVILGLKRRQTIVSLGISQCILAVNLP